MPRLLYALLLIMPALVFGQEKLSSDDLAKQAREMARLEAEIQGAIDEYNKRPRRLVVVKNSDEAIEKYTRPILQKIESWGSVNYPLEARGKIGGAVTVKFEIYSDGSLRSPIVIKSSGYEVLDRAAKQAVQSVSATYPFPSAIKEKTEILVMTETLNFIKSPAQQ